MGSPNDFKWDDDSPPGVCQLCQLQLEPHLADQFNQGYHDACYEECERREAEKERKAKKPKSGAIWIPEKYIHNYMGLAPAEKDIIAILSSHRNKATGLAAPGLKFLMERTGHSESTVKRAIRKLKGRKAIKRHGGGNNGVNSQYHLFGPGTDGPCLDEHCGKRKHIGGTKTAKVVAQDDNLSTE